MVPRIIKSLFGLHVDLWDFYHFIDWLVERTIWCHCFENEDVHGQTSWFQGVISIQLVLIFSLCFTKVWNLEIYVHRFRRLRVEEVNPNKLFSLNFFSHKSSINQNTINYNFIWRICKNWLLYKQIYYKASLHFWVVMLL